MSPGLTKVLTDFCRVFLLSLDCILFTALPSHFGCLWCIWGVWGAPLFCSDGPRPSKGEGAPLPFPALWSYSSFKLFGKEARHPWPKDCEHGYKQVSSIDHAKMRNGEIWWLCCIYSPSVEQWDGRSAFHRDSLLFFGLFFVEGSDGHLPTPAFLLLFPVQGHLCAPSASAATPWMLLGAAGGGGECAALSELTLPPQSRACCSAGLWSRALDGAGGNPEEGGNVCLIADVV